MKYILSILILLFNIVEAQAAIKAVCNARLRYISNGTQVVGSIECKIVGLPVESRELVAQNVTGAGVTSATIDTALSNRIINFAAARGVTLVATEIEISKIWTVIEEE